MTLLASQPITPAELIRKSTLLLPGLAVVVPLAFVHQPEIALWWAIALCTLGIPGVWILRHGLMRKVQAKTQERLTKQIRTFLHAQDPILWNAARFTKHLNDEALGERLLAVLQIDGSALPMQDFREVRETRFTVPAGELVVFDVRPRPRALERGTPNLPEPVIEAWN